MFKNTILVAVAPSKLFCEYPTLKQHQTATMCIALVSTSHPKYALIVIDNRDEFVLRPTSRPHWWTHKPSGHKVLSPRDLQRHERGTWMGITKQGRFAVLTNYREIMDDPDHPVQTVKSRGGMVTAWLGAPDNESLETFVKKMLEGRVVKGVGGFSLICGDLKRKGEKDVQPLAIISNRSDAVDGVPWIGEKRGKEWGLSNTVYEEPPTWAKIVSGKALLSEAIQKAVAEDVDEEGLADALFSVLDTDTLPVQPGMDFEKSIDFLRHSIFIPPICDDARQRDMEDAIANGKTKAAFKVIEDESDEALEEDHLQDNHHGFEKGAYGTQRQTVLLVDWNGNVTYKERALWDAHGNRIERGKSDVTFKFTVDGWN